ncbi:unnamed protein product, partial [Anisakis simplex]|uniref:Bap31 domain-containing protein n=1 Tax=Anisakis simplex TaxID=6269 RepID=A0A0M3JAQ3_ANISI
MFHEVPGLIAAHLFVQEVYLISEISALVFLTALLIYNIKNDVVFVDDKHLMALFNEYGVDIPDIPDGCKLRMGAEILRWIAWIVLNAVTWLIIGCALDRVAEKHHVSNNPTADNSSDPAAAT